MKSLQALKSEIYDLFAKYSCFEDENCGQSSRIKPICRDQIYEKQKEFIRTLFAAIWVQQPVLYEVSAGEKSDEKRWDSGYLFANMRAANMFAGDQREMKIYQPGDLNYVYYIWSFAALPMKEMNQKFKVEFDFSYENMIDENK